MHTSKENMNPFIKALPHDATSGLKHFVCIYKSQSWLYIHFSLHSCARKVHTIMLYIVRNTLNKSLPSIMQQPTHIPLQGVMLLPMSPCVTHYM